MKNTYRKIIIHVIAWAVLMSFPMLFPPPASMPNNKFPFEVFIPWIILIGFYYTNYYLFIPKLLFRKRVVLYLAVVLANALLLSSIPELLMLFKKNVPQPPISNQPPVNFLAIVHLSTLLIFLLVFIVSTSIAVLNELFDTWRLKQLVEVEKSKAELSFLRSQVNPHFLFNTLYSIYYLSVNKSEKAPEAIMKLSDIMRFVLTESQSDFIPLKKEINYIQQYIDLQKMRISDKTKVIFTVFIQNEEQQIAPLLFIPFVENAFKYGVSSHTDTAIAITIHTSESAINFSVQNAIFEIIGENRTNNVGLENVTQRLTLLYPQRHILSIANDGQNYMVNLQIQLTQSV